jgi:lysophospholipid acyltransferase (LPLAT)-like uncharacterized protein
MITSEQLTALMDLLDNLARGADVIAEAPEPTSLEEAQGIIAMARLTAAIISRTARNTAAMVGTIGTNVPLTPPELAKVPKELS